MQKKLGSDTKDFEAFGVIWKFYQAFYIPEDTDEFWDQYLNSAEKMIKQFPDIQIVRAFVSAYQNVLEKKLNGGE